MKKVLKEHKAAIVASQNDNTILELKLLDEGTIVEGSEESIPGEDETEQLKAANEVLDDNRKTLKIAAFGQGIGDEVTVRLYYIMQ